MLDWFRSKGDLRQRAMRLHEAIVEEARAPHLYAGLRVPDTLDGRLEMLALHVVLVLDRLGLAGADGKAMARALTEVYVIAMDDTMRAIGVGDLSVPRKVKKAAAVLYDRNRLYGDAIAASRSGNGSGAAHWHDRLLEALKALPAAPTVDLAGLAHYADARVVAYATLPDTALLAGRLTP